MPSGQFYPWPVLCFIKGSMKALNFLLIWIMALAVTIAYAGSSKDSSVPTRIQKKELPPPPRVEVDEEERELAVDEEKLPEAPRRFNLSLGASFGQQLGCVVPNCNSFVPIRAVCGVQVIYANQCMPPQMVNGRQVIYQDVYLPAPQQGGYQLGGPCMCQGQMNCPCARPTTNFLFINQMTPFPSVTPRWNGLSTKMAPAFVPQPQAQFEVPQQHQTPMNHRDFGFTPRDGFYPTSGMMQ